MSERERERDIDIMTITLKDDKKFICTGCGQKLALKKEHKNSSKTAYVCVYCQCRDIPYKLVPRIEEKEKEEEEKADRGNATAPSIFF